MLLFWCQNGLDANTSSLLSDWISCLCTIQSIAANDSPSSMYCTSTGRLQCLSAVPQSIRSDWVNICHDGCRITMWWGLMGFMPHRVTSTVWLCMLSMMFLLFLGILQEVAITGTINAAWSLWMRFGACGLYLACIWAVSLVLQMWMPQELSRWHTKVQVKAMQNNKSGKDPQWW